MADYCWRPFEVKCCHFCWKTETEAGESFKLCAQCRNRRYCSKECQRQHWKLEHRALCKGEAQSAALERQRLPGTADQEIQAWFDLHNDLLTTLAAGSICHRLGITSSANCHQHLLNQAPFPLAVTYRMDGSFKIERDLSDQGPLRRAYLEKLAANSSSTLSKDWRMVLVPISIAVEDESRPSAEGSEPVTWLLRLAFDLSQVETYARQSASTRAIAETLLFFGKYQRIPYFYYPGQEKDQ